MLGREERRERGKERGKGRKEDRREVYVVFVCGKRY